jgi:GNAT superfamily N-acetyltransferase
MATDIHVRHASAEDTPAILDLVKLSLGEGRIPRHVDFWTWKHVTSPFGPSPILLAEAEGELVGLRVFMRWMWHGRRTAYPAVRAVDTATHPDWRGKGIFSRLTLALLERMKAEGTAFVFNTPNDQSRPGYLKMGWVGVGRVSVLVRPLRPLALARAILGSGRAQALTNGSPPLQSIAAPAQSLLEDRDASRFLDTLPASADRLATSRTRDYLRWRYATIPGFDYRALWRVDRDDGAVVIVRFKDDRGLRELRLCEVLVADSRASRAMGRELLHDILRSAGADYATAMAGARGPAGRVLIRCGFVPVPHLGPVMTIRPLNGTVNGLNPLRRSDWALSIGDLELF